jgi:hypothetical protein
VPADHTGAEAYHIVARTSTQFSIPKNTVRVNEQRVLEKAFDTAADITIAWDASGEYAGIQACAILECAMTRFALSTLVQ